MPVARCPKCKENIHVGADSEQGTLVSCDECSESLEIVGLDPIELDPHSHEDSYEYGEGFNVFEEEDS